MLCFHFDRGIYMYDYIGTVVGKKYRMLLQVASNENTDIYKAENTETKALVLIRILKPEFSRNEKYIDMLKKDYLNLKYCSGINESKIIENYFKDSINLYVSEYVKGISLDYFLLHKKISDWKDMLFITIQVLSKLKYINHNKMVHKYISAGCFKITDTARIEMVNIGASELDSSASVYYISPEQINGAEPDERSNIYSAGVLMYEIFSGRKPYNSENFQDVIKGHLNSSPAPLCSINPQIPEGIGWIVMKCLEKDPKNRHESFEMLIKQFSCFGQVKSQDELKRHVRSMLYEKNAMDTELNMRACIQITEYLAAENSDLKKNNKPDNSKNNSMVSYEEYCKLQAELKNKQAEIGKITKSYVDDVKRLYDNNNKLKEENEKLRKMLEASVKRKVMTFYALEKDEYESLKLYNTLK